MSDESEYSIRIFLAAGDVCLISEVHAIMGRWEINAPERERRTRRHIIPKITREEDIRFTREEQHGDQDS